MSSFRAVRVSTERSQQTWRISLPKETVGGEIVDRDGDHPSPIVIARPERGQEFGPSRRASFTLQHVVDEQRFLNVSACAEQLAGRSERLGDLGDDSGGPRIASFEPSDASR